MKKPMLVVLAGLPAAGKTSFALRLARRLFHDHGARVLVVSSDTVREEIPALREAFHPGLEAEVRPLTLDRVASGLRHGFWVVHDDLNYFRSMRFELVETARKLRVPHAFILVDTPREQCLKWNAARGRKVPDEVILKDHERFDPPGSAPWDEPAAVVTPPGPTGKEVAELAARLMERCAAYAPPPCRVPAPPREPSPAEKLELFSRKVMGELLRSRPAPGLGKELSLKRRELTARLIQEKRTGPEAEAVLRGELERVFRELIEKNGD